jgi:hypothetical protein
MSENVTVWVGEITHGEEDGTTLSEVLEPLVTAVEQVGLRLEEISRKLDGLQRIPKQLEDIRLVVGGM